MLFIVVAALAAPQTPTVPPQVASASVGFLNSKLQLPLLRLTNATDICVLSPPPQSDQLPLIRDYKSKIETELTDICDDILKIIEAELIPNSTSEEGKVFYYKMKGDYHR